MEGPRKLRVRAEMLKVEASRGTAMFATLARRDGLAGATRALGRILIDQVRYPVTRRRRMSERFRVFGHDLPYAMSRYNNTFRNERSVEISVARWFLSRRPSGRMLEVGNVLSHYGIEGHDVLDRYETIRGVMNEDIVGFVPPHPYDTVVSISTIEHVGWDESPRAPERAVAAFEALLGSATSGGRILVTFPIGYNPALDAGLRDRGVAMPIQTALIRTDSENHWVEASVEDGLTRRYGTPFNNANAVYVGMSDATYEAESA